MPVRITHCSNEAQFALAGHTVAEVAVRLREVFNIPPAAAAYVNGQKVEAGHILQDGDTLEFVAEIGEKGGLHDFWSEREVFELFGPEQVDAMRGAGLKLASQPVLTREEVIVFCFNGYGTKPGLG